MSDEQTACSYCAKKKCFFGDFSTAPPDCPTITRQAELEYSRQKLAEPENQRMAQDVARTWKDYGRLTRVEETVLYARLRGFKKLGVAFCVGLSEEAEKFTNLLRNEGFEVASACCMFGGFSSDDVELPVEEKAFGGGRQPMCNPIGQARLLDEAGCELNIILGLCVGDDTLFIKHSQAPVTVLAVKDRVLAHNPLGALYTARNIYTRLKVKRPKTDKP